MSIRTLLLVALCSFNALAQSSSLAAAEAPTETTAPDIRKPGDVNASYRLRGYEGCSAYQIDEIKGGLSDMVHMIDPTPRGRYKDFDWNSALAQDFWGPAERNRLYRAQIKGNLDRLAGVTYNWWLNPFVRSIHVRCDDPNSFCLPDKCAAEGALVLAYTINHKPHINFCPGYFTRKTLTEAMQGGSWALADMYYNQASIWAHELMHVEDIGHVADGALRNGLGDQPVKNWASKANQLAYGGENTKWMAQDPSGIFWNAAENADNYAYFVTMNYAQKTKGYYQSDPQIQISPQTYQTASFDNGTSADEAESSSVDGRCRWA